MDNKQKGNLAIASAIKHFDILFALCANDRAYAIPFQEIAGQTTVNVGRKSKWSKWERYFLPGTGDDCSPAE